MRAWGSKNTSRKNWGKSTTIVQGRVAWTGGVGDEKSRYIQICLKIYCISRYILEVELTEVVNG